MMFYRVLLHGFFENSGKLSINNMFYYFVPSAAVLLNRPGWTLMIHLCVIFIVLLYLQMVTKE